MAQPRDLAALTAEALEAAYQDHVKALFCVYLASTLPGYKQDKALAALRAGLDRLRAALATIRAI